jgi:hypothetical protein
VCGRTCERSCVQCAARGYSARKDCDRWPPIRSRPLAQPRRTPDSEGSFSNFDRRGARHYGARGLPARRRGGAAPARHYVSRQAARQARWARIPSGSVGTLLADPRAEYAGRRPMVCCAGRLGWRKGDFAAHQSPRRPGGPVVNVLRPRARGPGGSQFVSAGSGGRGCWSRASESRRALAA